MTIFCALAKDPRGYLGATWDLPHLEDILKEDYALLLTPLSFLRLEHRRAPTSIIMPLIT